MAYITASIQICVNNFANTGTAHFLRPLYYWYFQLSCFLTLPKYCTNASLVQSQTTSTRRSKCVHRKMSTKKENVANRPSPKSFSGSENLENSCKFFAAVKFRTQVFLLVDLENKTEAHFTCDELFLPGLILDTGASRQKKTTQRPWKSNILLNLVVVHVVRENPFTINK